MAIKTIREALAEAADILRRQGLSSPRLDAETLLAFVLGMTRTELYLKSLTPLAPQAAGAFGRLVRRRSAREPVAYITGEKEFMSMSFQVSRDVLIPRPETEIVVEWIIQKAKKTLLSKNIPFILSSKTGTDEGLFILDVGTGSGAIAVSLARYLPQAHVWAVDISERALAVARTNAERFKMKDRVTFLQGDLLSCIPLDLHGKFDFIAANLPYIPSNEVENLMIDVAGYEPVTALDGGDDGLDLYRRLIPQAHGVLKPGGWLGMETGEGQSAVLTSLLSESIWGESIILKDYAGLDRFVVTEKKN